MGNQREIILQEFAISCSKTLLKRLHLNRPTCKDCRHRHASCWEYPIPDEYALWTSVDKFHLTYIAYSCSM